MAEDILGISAQMDISDIQASLDRLCNDLNRVGVDSDALSRRMTKALNDVANSDDDLATKTSRAMQVLKTTMEEATKGIQGVPEMIDNANKHVETIEVTIGSLNDQLSKTDKGSDAFNSISRQIEAQRQSLELAKADVKDLVESYDSVRYSISQVNGAYQALGAFSVASSTANTVQSATNVSVGATATTAATATAAEAAAHISNAQAAVQNAEAENQNVEATQRLTDALQQYISVASGRAEIERMQSESTKELKADIKLYEDAIKEIQQQLASTDYAKSIEETTKKIEAQKARIESFKEAMSNLSAEDSQTGNGVNYYNQLIRQAQGNIDALQAKIDGMRDEQQRLNADLQEYTTLLEAANQIQSGNTIVQPESSSSTVSINVEDSSLSELNSKLEENKQKLQELEAEADKFSGKTLGDKQQQELQNLQSEIEKTKATITNIQEAIREKNEETFIGRLRNDLSDIGQKLSDFGQSIKDKITQPFDELKAKVGESSIGQRFGAEFEQAKSGLKDFKDAITNVMTGNGKLQGEIGKVGDAFKALGIPIGGSLTAIKAVTKALWGMCATPIGAVIAAVAVAFKALHTWLTKSAEGQKVLTKLSAYFGSIMSSITDIVVIFGKYLYHAFADNNGPMNSFAKSFAKTFKTAVGAAISLIGGLGTTLKGIFTLDWDTFTEGLSKTWDGLKKAGSAAISAIETSIKGTTGVLKTAYDMLTNDKLAKELSVAVGGIFTKASSAAKIASQELEANIQLGKEKEKQAKLDQQIAANREKIYTLTGKAKDTMIEETKALLKQKYDGQIKAQQQLYELQKKRNQMHTASLEDIKKERELHIGVLTTQAQQIASTRMLTRMQEANRRSMENAEKQKNKKAQTDANKEQRQDNAVTSAEGKLANVIYNNELARIKAEQEVEDDVTDAKIKAMKEGEEKVIAQRKRDLDKEISQIEEKKNALIKAERDRQKAEFEAQQAVIKAKGGKVEQWNDDKLDQEPIKKIEKQYELIEKYTVESSNAQSLKAVTDKYQTEAQKRLELEQQYNNDIVLIQEARAQKEKELAEATTQERKAEIQKQISNLLAAEAKAVKDKGEALAGFDFDQLKKNPEYVQAFENLNAVGTKTLDHLISLFEKAKESAAQSMSPDQLREYTKTLEQMYETLISRKDPFKQVEEARAEYSSDNKRVKSIEKYLKALKKGEKGAKDAAKAEKELGKSYKSQEEAEQDLEKAKEKRNKSQNKYTKALKNLQEKVKDLASAINSLGQAIGGTEGQIISLCGDVMTFFVNTVDGIKMLAATGAQALSTIEKASVILTIISAAIQLLQKISALYKDSHAQYEEYAKEIKKVNDLTNAVNEYKLACLAANQAKEKWFDTTGLKDLRDAYDYNKKSLESYYDTLLQAQAIYQDEKGGGWLTNSLKAVTSFGAKMISAPAQLLRKGLEAVGVNMGKTMSSIFDWATTGVTFGVAGLIGKGLGALVDGSDSYAKGTTAAYKNLRIETRKKTSGFLGSGIGAKKQKTEDLTTWARNNGYGELFDENLMINVDAAQNIIDKFGDKLVGETKETLEELIKFRQEYDKFNEQLEEYVSSAFSPLTDNLTDALFDWLDTGEDVMDKFKEYASDTFKDIAKEIVKTMIVQDVFDDYSSKIKEMYKMYSLGAIDGKDLMSYVAKETGTLLDGIEKKLPLMQDIVSYINDEFEKRGISLNESSQSEQTATGKAIEAITADQSATLIGIGYAMQSALEVGNEMRKAMCVDVSVLRIYSENISNNIAEMRDVQYQGLEQLQAINKNTAPIILIREDIASMYKLMKERY